MTATLHASARPDVREAYVQAFAQIQLKATFTDELVVASDTVAHVLTRSHGIQTTRSTSAGRLSPTARCFAPENDAWKIARHPFNKPN